MEPLCQARVQCDGITQPGLPFPLFHGGQLTGAAHKLGNAVWKARWKLGQRLLPQRRQLLQWLLLWLWLLTR